MQVNRVSSVAQAAPVAIFGLKKPTPQKLGAGLPSPLNIRGAQPARQSFRFGEGGPLEIDGVLGDFVMDVVVRGHRIPTALHNILKRIQANKEINTMMAYAVLRYRNSGEEAERFVEQETRLIEAKYGLRPPIEDETPPSNGKNQ